MITRHENEPSYTAPIQSGPRKGMTPVFCPGHGAVVYFEPSKDGEHLIVCDECGDEIPAFVFGVDSYEPFVTGGRAD